MGGIWNAGKRLLIIKNRKYRVGCKYVRVNH